MKNIFCVFTIITLLEYSLAVPTNTTTAFVKTTTTKAPAPPPSGGGGGNPDPCFCADNIVTLANHDQVPIGELKSGDQLLTVENNMIQSTEMVIMLDRSKSSRTLCRTIYTESGHRISLTAWHLIAIKNGHDTIKYVFANDIQEGDQLIVAKDNQVESSVVIKISEQVQRGYFAPATMSGNLLVNGVLASSYAIVKDHYAGHFWMAPLRWYYQLSKYFPFFNPFGEQEVEGIHPIVHSMYDLAKYVAPSKLNS